MNSTKINFFRAHNNKNIIIILAVICISSFIIRLYYFPHSVPITLDGIDYFSYAIELSRTGEFPHYHSFTNNGWPSFLSVFFSLHKSNNFLEYMEIQRYLSVIISVLTTIPIYIFCKRFFSRTYALLGSILFAFDPRLIINSLLGLTDPFFIFLITISLFLFLSRNIKSIYTSFVILAFAVLVRYEGLILIIPCSIIFFLRFKNEDKIILKYSIAIVCFLLIILPMVYIRIQTTGTDGLISHLLAGTD